MLWIGLIDIIFLIVGVLLGYIICITVHRDIFTDECESCEYRKFIEGLVNDERE